MTSYQHFTNATAGLVGSSLAVISTFQENLEWGIRVTGGLLGIAIGVISLYRLMRHPVKPLGKTLTTNNSSNPTP